MKLSAYLSLSGETPRNFGSRIGVKGAATVYRYINGLRTPARSVLVQIEMATDGAVTANDFISARSPSPEARA